MRDWHVKHMERTLVKFVTGLSSESSRWERRMHKKYGTLSKVCKRVEYDIKHGVTNKEVNSFLQLMKTDPSYCEVRAQEGSSERLADIQDHFIEALRNGQKPW